MRAMERYENRLQRRAPGNKESGRCAQNLIISCRLHWIMICECFQHHRWLRNSAADSHTHTQQSDRAFARSAAINLRIKFQSAKRRRNFSFLEDAKGGKETHGLPFSTWTPMDWNLVVGVCSSFRIGCTQSTCHKRNNSDPIHLEFKIVMIQL